MVEATNICGNCKYYESTDLWYLGICRKHLIDDEHDKVCVNDWMCNDGEYDEEEYNGDQ